MDIENYEPRRKVPKIESMNTENKGYKMLESMGWEGKGLGKQNQGLEEPIQVSTHFRRHGIGIKDEDLGIEAPETVWEPGMDEALATSDIVSGIDGNRLYSDDNNLLFDKVIGERKDTLKDEKTFCDPDLLIEMLKSKSVLDKYDNFFDGRERSNPYEKIGRAFFLNRAAMKMANLDYVVNNLFTEVENNETLFFADICAGPGGFTEFMLWKRCLQSCGFGFTLRGKDDFKLKSILCGPVECFHPSYGKADDGDITNEDNLRKFQSEIMQSTSGIGVHTVLADGGFDVSGKESIQELLSKQLYLCQFLCAINILRVGGNFVCKLFDTFTDFSVGLIYLVSALFVKVTIVKPITSRPANSERYIIFQSFIDQPDRIDNIRQYLFQVNSDLNEMKDSKRDVLRIISQKVLNHDKQFVHFIKDINNKILRQQIIALVKLHSFIENKNLVDERQIDIRKEALELWNIPDLKRDHFLNERGPPSFTNFVNMNFKNRLETLNDPAQKSVTSLKQADFVKDKFVLRNHYAAFVGPQSVNSMERPLYLLVKNKKHINYYAKNNAGPSRIFEELKKWSLSFPSFTILLVHIGHEFSGSKGNIKYNSIVVVDSPMIYGDDISELSYDERMLKVKNLCKLLDPKLKGLVRPIDYFPLSDIESFTSRYVSLKRAKGISEQNMVTDRKIDHFFPLSKLMIINIINDPWVVAISKSKGYTYYFNAHSKQSIVEKPDDLYASYQKSNIYELDWKSDNDEFDCLKLLSLIDRK